MHFPDCGDNQWSSNDTPPYMELPTGHLTPKVPLRGGVHMGGEVIASFKFIRGVWVWIIYDPSQ